MCYFFFYQKSNAAMPTEAQRLLDCFVTTNFRNSLPFSVIIHYNNILCVTHQVNHKPSAFVNAYLIA
jgi:hypothetical protein